MNKKQNTSWGHVSDWYHELLTIKDTYQEKVIAPNLVRIANLKKNERALDVACGEGYFVRTLEKTGAHITGADISPELIGIAKKLSPKSTFFIAPIEDLRFAKNNSFNVVTCVLSLQNIEHLRKGIKEVARVLVSTGRFIIILNHPCFRIPKRSAWGFDEKSGIQYRRLDGYLSESRANIDMHPGKTAHGKQAPVTYSFHRPLQVYVKALISDGFVVTRLEEWNSHKKSSPGPRAEAENRARKEFPLFLCLVAEKVHDSIKKV
ncbi:MAG: class I SAM-dependent methyltransferase [Parcubacteria group bacterium]|nr:class I SAM-dependent methyltransferase [Parcubacteria group bacterium]